MIIHNFDSEIYLQIVEAELNLNEKRSLFDQCIIDEDMDNSLQRDILGDLLFSAVYYCAEKRFEYKVVQILLSLIEEELLSMINLTYDPTLPPSERVSQLTKKMVSYLESAKQKGLNITEWKSICDFVTMSFYRDLEAYYFMLTNIPSIAERNIDVVVDTPIHYIQQLS